jgi:hypothetical protein
MTSINLHDQTALNTTLADMPPLPMAALMIGVYNLLQEGADLPQPCYLTVSEGSQQIDMQFPGKHTSLRAITGWAHRHGSAVTKHPHHDERGQYTRVTATFGYAYIPAAPASI